MSLPRLPPPLRTTEFYVLLALVTEPSHAYELRGRIYNLSMDSFQISTGTLYPLITVMCEEGYLASAGMQPAGKSGKPREYYRLTEYGAIRLQEELLRLEHAVEVGKRAGLLSRPVPTELQRLLVQVKVGAERL